MLKEGGAHLNGKVEERVHEVVRQEVRLQAQVDQLGALGVVVVLFRLHAGVGHVGHLCRSNTWVSGTTPGLENNLYKACGLLANAGSCMAAKKWDHEVVPGIQLGPPDQPIFHLCQRQP